MGAEARGGTPQDLAAYITGETAKWKPVIADLHIKAD
jgi:hypothetical protein